MNTPNDATKLATQQKLEKDVQAAAKTALIQTPQEGLKTLQEAMNQGSVEFQQKTGRQMTYAEMRQMWG